MTTRIAMWSGPRNLSTALMRSFGARADTAVVDEPLYAHYLRETELDHPLRDAVLASQSQDWEVVTAQLLAPSSAAVLYQKHMAHHLLPRVGRKWMRSVKNVLLLRHPRLMIQSYAAKRESFGAVDLGLMQLAEIHDWLTAEGLPAWVIDSQDILNDPERALSALCTALEIPFDPAMLSWSAGAHPDDGVWGAHWYDAVRASTGFGPPRSVPDDVGEYEDLVRLHQGVWDRLHACSAPFR